MIATFRVDLTIEIETDKSEPDGAAYVKVENLIKQGVPTEYKIDIQDVECLHITGEK